MYSTCNYKINFEEFGDFFMRDFEGDIGNEPNCEAIENQDQWGRPDVYRSPDLWNSYSAGSNSSTEHENPIEGNHNYVFARVTNLSNECEVSGAGVKFYWTVASTGETWDDDWIADVQNGCTIGDYIGTSYTGIIAPGQERLVSFNWIPPIINDLIDCDIYRYPWDEENETYQVCLLARLISNEDHLFNEIEGINIEDNVVNSNNIVTRNTKLLDDPNKIYYPPDNVEAVFIGDPSNVIIHNNNDTTEEIDIVITCGPIPNIPFDFKNIEILVSDELYQQISGGEGNSNIPGNPVRLNGSNSLVIPNIVMSPDERQMIGVRVSVLESNLEEYFRLDEDISFSISHKSSSGKSINPSNNCYFTVPIHSGSENLNKLVSSMENQLKSEIEFDEIIIYESTGRLLYRISTSQDINIQSLDNIQTNGLYIFTYLNKGKFVKTKKKVVSKY